jgi:genome maintenance exonuclease 1
MITFNPKYKYEKLTRIDGPSRLYATPDGSRVPSVTTILSATADKTALVEWRKRVGDAEATRISTESAGLGTLVHKHVENFIEGIERPPGNTPIHVLARSMSDMIINNGRPGVDEVWGMEASLYYPGLYAGTTDLCGVYKGVPSIMDHKTAKKMKKPEWMQDYFIQTTAYALAHNEVHGTDIKQGVLFMADREGAYNTFIIEGAEFKHYSDLWLQRVEQYYKLV